MRRKVAVFFGGRSLESDISTITAMQVLRHIDRSKFIVEPTFMYEGGFYVKGVDDLASFKAFDPALHMRVILADGALNSVKRGRIREYFKPDVALVCCHGGEGENGVLQGLLEYNGIPSASSSLAASAYTMDKLTSKRLFDALGLPILPYIPLSSEDVNGDMEGVLDRLEEKLGYPVIVKPASLGSSIGIGAANDRSELKFALEVSSKFDRRLLAERMLVDFKEVNCAAFRDRDRIIVSSTEQPVSAGAFLSFDDKYMSGGKLSEAGRIMPADIGVELNERVRQTTRYIYEALELGGVARVDYLVDGDRLYVNEINTVPGSLAFYLFEEGGIDFASLITSLISNACDYQALHRTLKTFRTQVLSRFSGGFKLKK